MKRDENETRFFPVARKRLTAKSIILCLFITVVVVMAVGSLKAEARTASDGRYYYTCEIPDTWIARMISLDTVKVYSWADFKREAWKRKYPYKSIHAFIVGIDIFLKESFLDVDLYHELGHSYDFYTGRSDTHDADCWSTELPYNYDGIIGDKLKGFGYLRDGI